VLATALVLTMSEAALRVPAAADDPVVVITSPPPPVGSPADPRLTITVGNPVDGSATITVDNPGGTAPTAQECIPLVTTVESFCLGQSGNMLYPNGTIYPPVTITNAPTAPGGLPGDQMDWIIDEAYAATADAHGVDNDDMVKAFARPEIRAYVQTRLQGIVDQKLYGEPMTDQEEAAFEALEALYKEKQVAAANAALYEYDLWTSDPCGYVPPAPPTGSGLAAAPNPVAGTAMCSAANKVQFYRLTNNTPPAETFEKWAAYRNPTDLVTHANDPAIRYMVGKTRAGVIAIGAVGAAVLVGAAVGLGLSATAAIAAAPGIFGWAIPYLALGPIAAAAGPAIIIAAALIILAVAVWQMAEDAKPGEQIRDRAARAAESTDPLGVRGRIADYAGLSFPDREDPASGDPAVVHTQAFEEGLEGQVAEFMMFDEGGDPILDPLTGYTVTGSAPDDLHFADGDGDPLPFVEVAAPPGALDRNGNGVNGYRVLFSRGWLMVAERSAATGTWSAYRPQLTLTYVDEDGDLAQMSLLRHQEGDDPAEIDFTVVRPSAAADELFDLTPEWTFTALGGGLQTVSLLPFDPMLLPVNVVPSVQGVLVADNVVRLSANVSTPGQSLSGSTSWLLERLDEAGAVVETIPLPAQASLLKRMDTPGRYRATATFTAAGPPSLTRTGVVEYVVEQPAPEVLSATVRDDRVLNGSLFLDLRLLQPTLDDTFTVDVAWANDARGNVITETYTVQCQDTGSAISSCDTGPMILPETAPTNGNWSSSPTYRIPDDHDFLPQVTVTITNSYGHVTTRTFPIEGDHRPSYATQTPHAEMPAGTFSRVDVVEVFPSPLLVDSQDLTILPYVQSIAEQLPEGVHADIEERNGHWYLQVAGTPQADAIGTYVFYFPFEQEPLGMALRPPPALATVEIKAATEPGYRSTLRDTPTAFLDRQYRNSYPDYHVQVAQVLDDSEDEFGTFTGTVKCRLTAGPTVVFDKVCQADAPFPWPTEKVSDTLVASTYLESDEQPLSADGPYSIDLSTKFVDPTLTHTPLSTLLERFTMTLRDLNAVLPPFSAGGYQVTCSQDGGAYAACLDTGTLELPRVPGAHTLDVRVRAPDGATTTTPVPWDVSTPKATFAVSAPDKPKKRGAKALVKVSGLLPNERFVIRIDGVRVASGIASLDGRVRVRVGVPRRADLGKVKVTVQGATADRTGKDRMRVVD
jgi:hypothetical protein